MTTSCEWSDSARDGGGDDDSSAMLAAAESFVDEYESSTASDCDAVTSALGATIAVADELMGVEVATFQCFDGHASSVASSVAPVAPASTDANALSSVRISSTAEEDRKKPRRRDPNKWRIARKQEMTHLRFRVSELEAQLRHMHQQRDPRSVLTSPGRHARSRAERHGRGLRFVIPSSAVPSALTVASVWKMIAQNQSSERTCCERENSRLKLVLESQRQIASNLQRLLNKCTATRDIEKCVYQGKGAHTACLPAADWMDNRNVDDLLAEISVMYSEIDVMLSAINLAQSDGSHVTARIFTDEHQDLRIEVLGSKVFPFGIHATGAAVWSHFLSAKERIPSRHYFHTTPKEINAEEGTIHENFILELFLNKTSVRYRMKQILRQYVEKDRVVVIWRGYFDPIEMSSKPITGAQFVAKGFAVVKRPAGSSGEASLVQTCYFMKPELSGDLSDSKNPLVDALFDFVLKTTAGNITASHQIIENALLEQALHKAS